MKTFKDFAVADVQNVFLNLNEFADYHDIDGEKIKCVIDKNIISEIPENGLVGDFINMTTLYADSKDLEAPEEGQWMSIDDSRHIVKSVSIEGTMLVIVLRENQQ